MRKIILVTLMLCVSISIHGQTSSGDPFDTGQGNLTVYPVLHGTLALTWGSRIIIVDPYGGKDALGIFSEPDLILITDIHGDHMNSATLDEINTENALFVVPQAVADKMDEKYKQEIQVLKNGTETVWNDIKITALPMYNLPENADSRHTKGRGNGYVLTIGNKKIYISGDTEDIPEMRALKDIDIAFVCMNMPYTMDVGQAADAVLEFKPRVVYPYHYRGSGGLSDIEKFKSLVNAGDKNIEVRLRDWYPGN